MKLFSSNTQIRRSGFPTALYSIRRSFSPANACGKRISKNVYAKTREECEKKLAKLIAQTKAEIAEEKNRPKAETQRREPSKSALPETKK